jgi:hypothetical protein
MSEQNPPEAAPGAPRPSEDLAAGDGLGGSVPPPQNHPVPPPPAAEHARDDAPRLSYAMDTLLIEIGRLNRVIRRVEETPATTATEKLERAQIVTQLMRKVVALLDAVDVLGEAQASEADS